MLANRHTPEECIPGRQLLGRLLVFGNSYHAPPNCGPIRKCLNFIMFDRGTERGACNGKSVFFFRRFEY